MLGAWGWQKAWSKCHVAVQGSHYSGATHRIYLYPAAMYILYVMSHPACHAQTSCISMSLAHRSCASALLMPLFLGTEGYTFINTKLPPRFNVQDFMLYSQAESQQDVPLLCQAGPTMRWTTDRCRLYWLGEASWPRLKRDCQVRSGCMQPDLLDDLINIL